MRSFSSTTLLVLASLVLATTVSVTLAAATTVRTAPGGLPSIASSIMPTKVPSSAVIPPPIVPTSVIVSPGGGASPTMNATNPSASNQPSGACSMLGSQYRTATLVAFAGLTVVMAITF
ncbi:hypothetical protein BGZ98_010327 [Dissophora globulifera]|nr:hypothetical protein BGZ98_010327 [Dissophora globulifera]